MTDAIVAALFDVETIRLPIAAVAGYLPARRLLVLSETATDAECVAAVEEVRQRVAQEH